MREAARNIELPLDRTWKGHVPACATEQSACGTVRMQRVMLVGTPRDVENDATSCLGTTQPLGCMPDGHPTRELDAFERALAFARTIPALTPEELGLSSSGIRAVQEVERIELWLEPRDRTSLAASSCNHYTHSGQPATLRMRAGWQLQLPVPVVLCATATLCVLSAIALGLL